MVANPSRIKITDEMRKQYKLYRVWMDQREIHVSVRSFSRVKLMSSNNVGAFVFYSSELEKELDENPDMIGNYLAFRNSVHELVFAQTVEEAIQIVKEKHEESLDFGGNERKEQKALWLTGRVDVMDKICQYMQLNPNDGRFICGEYVPHVDGGEFGGCWLSGCDPLDSCEGDWINEIMAGS